jgi:Rad3-related DNA helicase
MVPQANIILLTHGYLETRFLRDVLVKILRKAEDYGFRSGRNRDVIIDEAHNFGHSIEAQLSRTQLVRTFEITPVPIVEKLVSLLSLPLGRVERPVGTFVKDLSQLTHFLAQKRNRRVFPEEDYEAIQAVKTFVERKGQHWVLNEEGLVQLDPWPSPIFELLFLHFRQVLLLSGTFYKIQWYDYFFTYKLKEKGMTGRTFTRVTVPSSLDRRRQLFLGALYHGGVSSKPEHRTPEFYEWVADIIHEASLLAKDHTFVFVPSYEALEELYPLLCTRLKTQLSVYREPAKGRIPFLSTLVEGPPSVIIGVYGGKFAEGIEIRHPETGRSRVRVLILVGLPFPPPTPEYMFLDRIYRTRNFGMHFSRWALVVRHLHTKVHQVLGRIIRSERDLGAALILDYRAITKLRFHLPGMNVYRSRDRLMNALTFALRKMK